MSHIGNALMKTSLFLAIFIGLSVYILPSHAQTSNTHSEEGFIILQDCANQLAEKKYSEALSSAEWVLKKKDNFSSKDIAYAYRFRAIAYDNLGDKQKALLDFAKVADDTILAKRTRDQIIHRMALIYFDLGDYSSAKEQIDKYFDNKGAWTDNTISLRYRANLMVGDIEELIKYLDYVIPGIKLSYKGNLQFELDEIVRLNRSDRESKFDAYIKQLENVEITDRPAVIKKTVAPRYPNDAAKKGIQGWVLIEFDVSKKGKVEKPRVLDANPKKVFDRAALNAVKKWKFKPKLVNGKPVMQKNKEYQMTFALEN